MPDTAQNSAQAPEFRGQHTPLSCFFQGTELRDSLGSGERSARQDAVGEFPGQHTPVENLSLEVAELRARVHRLQAENHEFRQHAGYRKSRHRDNINRINMLERNGEPGRKGGHTGMALSSRKRFGQNGLQLT